jgi:membrane protein required for colicin V production
VLNWSWIDWVFAGLLVVSIGVGCMRGLVFEVMSLLGWLVAYGAALVFAPQWAPSLPIGQPGGPLNALAAFGLIFLGALIVWGLTAQVVRWLVHATPLSVIDRLLGGFFGLVRGALILLCVTTAVAFTPWADSPQWRAAPSARWASEALVVIKPWLPNELSRFFPSGLNDS